MKRLVTMGGPRLGFQERAAADKVLRSGKLAQGEQVLKFEQEFSLRVGGAVSSLAVNSGTSALHLSALALGLGPGDDIIVPAFTFAASANAMALTGATVRFADVRPDTFNLDLESAQKLLSKKTKAIVFVHLYGNPKGIAEATKFAKDNGLLLIEDAAQAHGAKWDGISAGAWGDVAAFSFYPTKNMTTGEGGMVTSRNQDLIRNVGLLRNQGMRVRYENEIIGFNNRMTEYAAAIGRVQLRRLDNFIELRQASAASYSAELESKESVLAPATDQRAQHSFHQYTVRVLRGSRNSIAQRLKDFGVDSAVYYPFPLTQLKPYAASPDSRSLPVSESLTQQVLSIPINPSIGHRAIKKVARALRGLD
jgi:dTDP-4-amino-4,6-dideoxygalactose transaminase